MNTQHRVFLGNYSYDPSQVLGKGTTGIVYQGISIHDGYNVAIKVINLAQNQNQITRTLLETQKKALRTLKQNPNVIKLLDIIEHNQFCYIVTDLYKGSTLKEYIMSKRTLCEQQAIKIFRKIIFGYCAVSDAFIIHRDLKPANIMMKQNNEPVIIDFGFCEIIQVKTVMKAFNVGSPSYMSPEAYKKTLFSQKSDIWSLGTIFYEMLTGQTLDQGLDNKCFFQILSQGFLSQKLNHLSGICKQVLQQVLKVNSQDRISCHKMKYLFDKNNVDKLNGKNSMVSNQQENKMFSSIKNLPNLDQGRQFYPNSNRKDQLTTFQSVPLESIKTSFTGARNNFSQLTVFDSTLNLKSKLAQSRYRPVFLSPPQGNQSLQQRQFKVEFPLKQRNIDTNVLRSLDSSQNKTSFLQNNYMGSQKFINLSISNHSTSNTYTTIAKPLIYKEYKETTQLYINRNSAQNKQQRTCVINQRQFLGDSIEKQNITSFNNISYTSEQNIILKKSQTTNSNKFSFKNSSLLNGQDFNQRKYQQVENVSRSINFDRESSLHEQYKWKSSIYNQNQWQNSMTSSTGGKNYILTGHQQGYKTNQHSYKPVFIKSYKQSQRIY